MRRPNPGRQRSRRLRRPCPHVCYYAQATQKFHPLGGRRPARSDGSRSAVVPVLRGCPGLAAILGELAVGRPLTEDRSIATTTVDVEPGAVVRDIGVAASV